MPILALNRPSDADTLVDPLPLHLTPWAAASLESLLGGRSGRLGAGHRPALHALAGARVADADLHELLRELDEHGELQVEFL